MNPKKVLIVDDSGTIRQQVAGALQAAGFVVVEAADGVEGLERLAQHDVCLAIVDVNMPRLDGISMLERFQSDPNRSAVTVLMLTTEVQPELIERAKKAGARGWMIKPVKVDQLVSAVRKLTE